MKKLSRMRAALAVAAIALLAASALAFAGCACSSTAASSASSSSASSSSASSTGDMLTIPNVVSLTEADAGKALSASGFAVGEITRSASDTVPAGSVISQDPKAFTSAAKGSKVKLEISTGKAAAKDVSVPNLTGMSQADAEKTLSNNGLVGVASNPEVSTDVAPGLVFKQSIAAGTTVKEGTKIAFTVAMAPEQIAVPDVRGKSQDDAKATITNAKLGYDHTTAYNDDVAEGVVIAQSIAPGTQVNSGTTVTVTVSLGPKPQSDVKVPDVLTYSWSDAKRALESAGLQARYTGDPAGVVVSQDVAAGTMVAPGTLVTVKLETHEEMVKVPDLVGLSVTSAEEATDKLKLALHIDSGGEHGTVASQSPEADTEVPTRTTIHITVDSSEFE